MQAIILAAGVGHRLGSYTKENAKCMVPVSEARLIDRILMQLSTLHLKRVLMVVGYKEEELIHHVGERYADALKMEYVENPIYDRTNNIYSLSLVKEQVQEDDTFLVESDLIFSDRLFSMILADEHPNITLVAKYETWMDGTMVRINGNGNIVNFAPKKAFSYQEVNSYYKTVNTYKFSKMFSQTQYAPFLDAYCKALGNNEYYEQVLRVITLLDKTSLKALDIGNEKWYEIDDVQDLGITETVFAKDDKMLKRYDYRYGGCWHFPKMLDYCYLINPYFPCKQMKTKMKANFDTPLIEYPSGVYVNSLLAGKRFSTKQEYMVVGNGTAKLIKSLMENVKGHVGMVFPTFEEYPHRLQKEQIVSFAPPLNTLRHTTNDLMNLYKDSSIDILSFISPDNPSGDFIPKADVVRLVTQCKERNIRLVADESPANFSDDFLHNSFLCGGTLEVYPNLLVMKSISKSYGVPEPRLGILATSQRETIARIKKDVSIWNINSFAEPFIQIYNKYQAQYEKACQQFIDERSRFVLRLKEIHFLRILPTQANYFCCEVKPPCTTAELTEQLLARFDIVIKDCNSKTSLQGLNYIHISIRNQVDNDQLTTALFNLQNETI